MRVLQVHNHYQQAGGEDQVFAAEGQLLESAGHEVVRFEMDNRTIGSRGSIGLALKTIWNRQSYRQLSELIRTKRPQVMHVHNTFPLISPAAFYAAHRQNLPVVQTLHNYRLLCPAATFYRDGHICQDCLGHSVPWPGVRHACYRASRATSAGAAAMLTIHRALRTWRRCVDRFIALSSFAKGKFVEAGFPAERVTVKPNFLFPEPTLGTGSGGYAVFAGRLAPEKGIDTLLEAWKILAGASLPLKIVGDGLMSKEVEQAVACSQYKIQWLGHRSPSETQEIIGDASLLIFPSQWYEPFGLVAIEAFAKGTPVLASNMAAMTELVRPGATGDLFEPANPADLANKVQQMAQNADLLRRMRSEARREFEAKYTAATNYRMMIDIYESAIAGRCRSPAGEIEADLAAADV